MTAQRIASLVLAITAACGSPPAPRGGIAVAAAADRPPPARPVPCTVVRPGADLQGAVAAGADGDALCLEPGTYAGPVTLDRSVTLWGPRSARIHTGGTGTTVRLRAPGAALLGLTVDGSGGRYDLQDAAVHVGADAARVEGVLIENAIFGLVVEKARRVVIRGNRVRGTEEETLGLRGDAVRFWETYDSVIEGNHVSHSRDMVVWYASRNVIAGNTVTGSRYGTHFMYSHGNRVEGNRYVGNVVGVFVMYSRDLELRGNLIADSSGAAGLGLGMKESSALTVVDNVLVKNTVGFYLDTSPFVPEMPNRFAGNVVRLCGTGVVFHSSPRDNEFVGNSLRNNGRQVAVEGGGDASAIVWRHNDWDDYAGYDLDGDGLGDVPYELRSLANQLTSTYPPLAFLHGSPTLALVEAISHIVPLFRPGTVLVDPAPRMEPLTVESLGADRAA